MSERRVANLVAWVESGGHLITVAREPFDVESGESRDPLLDHLGVYLLAADFDEGVGSEEGEVDGEGASNESEDLQDGDGDGGGGSGSQMAGQEQEAGRVRTPVQRRSRDSRRSDGP